MTEKDATAKEALQLSRRVRYAGALLLVLDDPEIGGGSAAFDEALTNGLAAIVAHEWPGAEVSGNKVKSAAALLTEIKSRASIVADAKYAIKSADGNEVVVDVGLLQKGISETQSVWHGRAAKGAGLSQEILDAAEALDDHFSLRWLSVAKGDESDRRAERADWQARDQAAAYWERLSEEERARREDPGYAEDQLPGDPKERSSLPDVQYCDVCSAVAFVADGWDIFGGDRAPGICLACGYMKSDDIAEDEAILEKIEYEMGKPD